MKKILRNCFLALSAFSTVACSDDSVESLQFADLRPIEIYEKDGGEVNLASKYAISEMVRPLGGGIFERIIKIKNPSPSETRTFQVVVSAKTRFVPVNWVIPGVIYGDTAFGSQTSPSGLEYNGEPWVFSYDRSSIPSCTMSETGDALFAMFASDRDASSLRSSSSLEKLPDGTLLHKILYPVRESPVSFTCKYVYTDRYDEWITLLPGASFEASSYFMEARPRRLYGGYRELFAAAMANLKHNHPLPAMDAQTVYDASMRWVWDCCDKNVNEGKTQGASGTDLSFRLGYTSRTQVRNFPAWVTEEEKKLTLADLERNPSLNRAVLRTAWMPDIGFAGQNFMLHRMALKDAIARGDKEMVDWCLEDMDDWVSRQLPSGLVPTNRIKDKDNLSVTELGWGMGESVKMWQLLKENGIERPQLLEFSKRLADFFVENYSEQDGFGRMWSLSTGEKIECGGSGGGFIVKGMLELYDACSEKKYLDCARKAFDYYYAKDLSLFRCVAGADDCDCVDKEASFPYLYSALELYRRTGKHWYLDCAEQVASYFCSWMFCYDALYPPQSEFARFGYHTSGGTLVSAEHHCIDPYATVIIPDLFDLADLAGDELWREAGRLIWVNAIQDVAGPDGMTMFGIYRTPGAQNEAHSQTRWSKYRSNPSAARGNFNNQCTSFVVTFRLYALDRLGDPMASKF